MRQSHITGKRAWLPTKDSAMNTKSEEDADPGDALPKTTGKKQLGSLQSNTKLNRRGSTAAARKLRRKSRRQSLLSQELELLQDTAGDRKYSVSSHGRGRKPSQPRNDSSSGKAATDPLLPSQASQRLAESNKLEDQINLQHLVELMRIFHVCKSTLIVHHCISDVQVLGGE